LETWIRDAAQLPRDVGELVSNIVMINPLRIFWRDSKAAVAFIEITRAFDVFVIFGKFSVMIPAGAAATNPGF
jgi:hypothetical protein